MKPDEPRTTVVDDPQAIVVDDRAARNGASGTSSPARYCAFCGVDVNERAPATERFGESFCSESHAEEFVKGVRAARVQAAAASVQAASSSTAAGDVEEPAGARQPTWTDRLKKWGCWGAPLLLLLALPLVSGGGGIAAATGSVLSVLALLACPLAMYLMMRSMGSMSHDRHVNQGEKDGNVGGKREYGKGE